MIDCFNILQHQGFHTFPGLAKALFWNRSTYNTSRGAQFVLILTKKISRNSIQYTYIKTKLFDKALSDVPRENQFLYE